MAQGSPRVDAGINAGSRGSKNVNPLYKAAQSVTNYVGNVAREVRDIPTAVSTAVSGSGKFLGRGAAAKDVVTQVRETASAAATGKKGTTAYTGKSGTMLKGTKETGVSNPDYRVTKTKRK